VSGHAEHILSHCRRFLKCCLLSGLLWSLLCYIQATDVQPSSLYTSGVPPYISYSTLAGPCLTAAPQAHILRHSTGAPISLTNNGVQFLVHPAAATATAIPSQQPPPQPLCITSLVLTPVSGLPGELENILLIME